MKRFFRVLSLMTLLLTQGYSQIVWTKDTLNNPVLKRGVNGTWDDGLLAGLFTIFDGTMYHGWYGGNDDNSTNIGYVSSADGINWTKHAGPVLSNGQNSTWDDFVVYQPSVIFDGEMYYMWFGGHNGFNNRQIGYATSTDSINWTKYENNPVLQPGTADSWDDLWVDSPCVLKIDSVYHMWYSGSDGSVTQSGHATSVDGITWEKDALNPVLEVGPATDWDKDMAYQPSVLIDKSGKYHMFYSGGSSFKWKMGYASSMDGLHWIKYESNPVLTPGDIGSWDDTFTGLATVSFNHDSSAFKMWYTGNNSTDVSGWEIGYAESNLALDIKHDLLEAAPVRFSLSQNYPNPFNPTTTISYQLPVNNEVELSIYNLLGQKVVTLVNKNQPAGSHQVQWHANGFANGVYYYRIKAGNFVQTRKMIYLK